MGKPTAPPRQVRQSLPNSPTFSRKVISSYVSDQLSLFLLTVGKFSKKFPQKLWELLHLEIALMVLQGWRVVSMMTVFEVILCQKFRKSSENGTKNLIVFTETTRQREKDLSPLSLGLMRSDFSRKNSFFP